MDKKGFHIDGLLINHKFSYQSTEKQMGSNIVYYIDKQFQTESGRLNQNDLDKRRQSELNKTLKKAGIATRIGVSLITNAKN